MKFPTSRRRRLLLCALAAILFLFVGIFFLQSAVAHRKPPFLPDYPIIDLSPIWEQPRLDAEDYDTLFLQTGLVLRPSTAFGTAVRPVLTIFWKSNPLFLPLLL